MVIKYKAFNLKHITIFLLHNVTQGIIKANNSYKVVYKLIIKQDLNDYKIELSNLNSDYNWPVKSSIALKQYKNYR